jgi:uncharacterized protein with HEPN domain
MRQRPDEALLQTMLDCAKRAIDEASRTKLEDLHFLHGPSLVLERCIEIIGEAARNVSDGFKAAHPAIPWSIIVSTRHILAHDYDSIHYDKVWRIATVHLPELVRQLEPLVPPAPADPEPSDP